MVGSQSVDCEHGMECKESSAGKVGMVVGGEDRSPRDEVSFGHFIEQLAGVVEETAFCVRIKKGVGEWFVLGNAGFDELGMEFFDCG